MRNNDWLKQLLDLISKRRQTPHAWGTNDCCLFAADAILAMTGDDKAVALRGTYTTEAEAHQIIAKFGGLAPMLTHFLGEPRGPLCARRGDIVAFTAPNGQECVGVCVGAAFVCPGDERLNTFPMQMATQSWRVE